MSTITKINSTPNLRIILKLTYETGEEKIVILEEDKFYTIRYISSADNTVKDVTAKLTKISELIGATHDSFYNGEVYKLTLDCSDDYESEYIKINTSSIRDIEECIDPPTGEEEEVAKLEDRVLKIEAALENIPSTEGFAKTQDVIKMLEDYAKTENVTKTLEDYAKTENIPDVSNFVTPEVNNLINYYLKSETYSKDEVMAIINTICTMSFSKVDELPTENISKTTIYLVPKVDDDTEEQNIYSEYINLNGTTEGWECLGDTKVNLTGYAKIEDIPSTEGLAKTQDVVEMLEDYAKTEQIPSLEGYAKTEQIPSLEGYAKTEQIPVEKSATGQAIITGDLIVNGSDGTKKQIVFGEDGAITWIAYVENNQTPEEDPEGSDPDNGDPEVTDPESGNQTQE